MYPFIQSRPGRLLIRALGVFCLLAAVTAAVPLVRGWVQARAESTVEASSTEAHASGCKRLDRNTVELPPEALRSLGVRTAPVPSEGRPGTLPPLSGYLAVDANLLARVHSRFAGEVVALGTVQGRECTGEGTSDRPLRVGDRVKAGQLLAVVWSKDLGEKKSDLVDALSRLRLDREVLDRLRALHREGGTPDRSVREAERAVEADQIAAARAERTLRAWRLGDDEIKALYAEAERPEGKAADARAWPRVEIRAPRDGTILEKNLVAGDLVDTTSDLLKIADLSRLTVWVHVYEEELPELRNLPQPARWTVRLPGRPEAPWEGTLDRIGEVIDPNQRTVLVSGSVANPDGDLRVGQSITATIELPASPNEIAVPATALVEDGRESIVFVQPDPLCSVFEQRKVTVLRRHRDIVYLRRNSTMDHDGVMPGERLVLGGAVQIRDALLNLPAPPAKR